MNPSFTFPRLQPAIPRPQAPTTSAPGESRESNALRASVLDVALELGLANNGVVADWMFNNTLQEEEESEEPVSSPALTYGSSATSEESSSSQRFPITPALNPSHPPVSYGPSPEVIYPTPRFLPDRRDPQFPKHLGARVNVSTPVDVPYINPAATGSNVTFPEAPAYIPPRPATPSGRTKLRKKNRGDGYESDGGYVSETGKKKDKKKGVDVQEDAKELKARLKEEKKIEKKEKEEERKRKKSLVSAVTRSSSSKDKEKEKDKDSGYATGYETDGSKHSKSKSKKVKPAASLGNIGGDYEADAGSITSSLKKSKTRFFKLSTTKAPKPNFQEEFIPSPIVEKDKEVIPLPIAGRFAGTTGAQNFIPAPSLASNSSPILPPGASLASSLTLPPPERLPPITTHALDFDSVTSPVSSIDEPSAWRVSAVKKEVDRDSHSSADSGSSGSSNPRRRALQFSPTHDTGSGSYSTMTSATHTSQSHSHPHHGPPPSAMPSSMITSPPSSAQGHLKPPSISFPVTRSPSPNTPLSPTAPLNVVKGLKINPSLDTIPSHPYAASRGVSPIPLSPDSYVMVTPTTISAPQPPPITSPNSTSIRPRNPPTDGFGPRVITSPTATLPRRRLSPPTSALPPPSPHVHFPFSANDKPTHLSIVPSVNWVVPSPTEDAHFMTPPSVLAYYDIPPPSPPPMGPLPLPPNVSSSSPTELGAHPTTSAGVFPTMSQLRARMHDRAATKEFTQVMPNGSMQRGRELPFPARPILPASHSSNGSVGQGLEARASVKRYKDLNAAPAGERQTRGYEEVEGYYGGEEEEDDMKDVLERFEDEEDEDAFEPRGLSKALESRRSFEAGKGGRESFAVSEYYGTRDTMYSFADGAAPGDRNSRWSGSIYSRSSILDPDKSEETRERFLERVEAMLGGDEEKVEGRSMGRGRGGGERVIIPPVPNLPERYASPKKSWPPNKF